MKKVNLKFKALGAIKIFIFYKYFLLVFFKNITKINQFETNKNI